MITRTGSAERLWIASAMCALLLISGCVRLAESEGIKQDPPPREPQAEIDVDTPATGAAAGEAATDTADTSASAPAKPEYRIFRGSGRFTRSKSDAPATIQVGAGGDITLDFADADIRQVIQATLGDILGLNYVIAPEVQGAITAQTERPLSRDALLPAVESILRLHGVALVLDGALYRVQSIQGAARSPRAVRVGAGGTGYGVQIVQLNYVGAEDMRGLLMPLAGEGAVLHVDRSRNLLVLAGSQPEMKTLLDAVRVFDVNWLSGMSFGLFPLETASPKTLIEELRIILDTDQGGALAGVVRLVPIERMNAVLAISKQPRYLDGVRSWIERLDQGSQAGTDQQLYIYFVQNSKASELADVLNQVFGGKSSSATTASQPPTLAPGLEPVEIGSRTQPQPAPTGAAGQQPQEASARPANFTPPPARSGPGLSDTITLSAGREVRIVADEGRNALLISGSHADYRAVLRALHQLDRRPLEVLVEVTIADVTLSDRLEYGVRWFLQSADGKHGGTFSDLTSGAVGSTFPGLSYVFSSTNAKAVVDLLSSVTDVNIISAPQILVLNNQEAQLQVGAQVPVATQQSTSVDASGDPVIVSSIELKDTGVILKVTPRVNEGGLIILDIEQEVSQVSQDSAAGSLTPTISKRIITTTAAVQSGQTVALGGLIQDNKSNTKVGIPGLSAIPFLGALFRYTTDTLTRSELLVMVSPRVVSDMREAQEVTEELRRRMEDLERLEAKIRPIPKPDED
ncbi:MAG: type II secretion system secretin GspD [Alphaproteobacteria bacterium]|nr:type II secretion system secretin GspD [Alphaproteobacteria bacterium]